MYLHWNCQPTFAVYIVGTYVSSVVAYSDFTSKSPDYVLGKAGCAWTLLFHKIYTKSQFFSSTISSLNLVNRNHVRVSTHACCSTKITNGEDVYWSVQRHFSKILHQIENFTLYSTANILLSHILQLDQEMDLILDEKDTVKTTVNPGGQSGHQQFCAMQRD